MNIEMNSNSEYQKVQINASFETGSNGEMIRRSLLLNIREESVEKAFKLYKELLAKIEKDDGSQLNKKKNQLADEKKKEIPEKNIPYCPNCNVAMLLKQNSKKGNYFWGCPNFPACRQTRPYEEEKTEEIDLEEIQL